MQTTDGMLRSLDTSTLCFLKDMLHFYRTAEKKVRHQNFLSSTLHHFTISGSATVTVADPMQQLKTIRIQLNAVVKGQGKTGQQHLKITPGAPSLT